MDHAFIESHDIIRRYATGRLGDAELERFEAHFLDCVECQGEIELFEMMQQGFRDIAAESVTRIDCRRSRPVTPARFALAAAVAALAVVPVWMVLNEPTLPAAMPTGDLPILPVTQLRDAGGDPQAALRPVAGKPFILMLELDWPEHSSYSVTIRDVHGVAVWQGDGLQPNYLDSLAVSVPPGFLAAGIYRADIVAEDGPSVGSFPFEILP